MSTFTFNPKSRILNKLHSFFLMVVAAYAIFLVWEGVVFAQIPRPTANQEELTRRVERLEDENLEHRVTVMETILSDLQQTALWTRLNMAGTGLLITEAVTRAIAAKRKRGGEQ